MANICERERVIGVHERRSVFVICDWSVTFEKIERERERERTFSRERERERERRKIVIH